MDGTDAVKGSFALGGRLYLEATGVAGATTVSTACMPMSSCGSQISSYEPSAKRESTTTV